MAWSVKTMMDDMDKNQGSFLSPKELQGGGRRLWLNEEKLRVGVFTWLARIGSGRPEELYTENFRAAWVGVLQNKERAAGTDWKNWMRETAPYLKRIRLGIPSVANTTNVVEQLMQIDYAKTFKNGSCPTHPAGLQPEHFILLFTSYSEKLNEILASCREGGKEQIFLDALNSRMNQLRSEFVDANNLTCRFDTEMKPPRGIVAVKHEER